MIKIGLTGSIGMGKSTVLKIFADLGALVWNADEAVHKLYAKGGRAVEPIRDFFPEAVIDDAVDRATLAGLVLNSAEAIEKLEKIVHPLVGADREAFLTEAANANAQAVVLDIPLLFEGGSENLFDAVVVVSAPADIQRARVLARPGMSEEKFKAISAMQMSDKEKCQKADYVVNTGQPIEKTKEDAAGIYKEILAG
jgi:dephospho-CoA kinase